ncbi:MAG: helix-turn-helix transcriptional regulator [Holophagales bacterium]|nr:helix-turn-helix transcriptional regulator [Holophagales bacterium]MYF03862.1 helix-turn-helix transcriptional regulator [Holophagales bacterium]MYJ26254.1 helix-turn-helix transcriptional regulator [Holophagales bacterium]
MPTPHHPPAAVRRALQKLGADLRDARRRRGLSMQVVADRAFTTRATLQRIEAGDHRVSLGILAAVVHALGFLDELADTADWRRDEFGHSLLTASLPRRARGRRHR